MVMSDGSPPVSGVRAYWIGSVVAWIAVWLGTAVALSGSGQFGKVLPILVAGNLIGLGADALPGDRQLLGQRWCGQSSSRVMIVLGESPYLGRELVVLAAGATVVRRGGAARRGPPEPGPAGRSPCSLTRVPRSELSVPRSSVPYASTPRPPRHAQTMSPTPVPRSWPSTGGVAAPIIVEAERVPGGCDRDRLPWPR